MQFYSVNREGDLAGPVLDFDTSVPVTEHRTLAAVGRVVGTAIGRWLFSGLDLPDMEATDGVSEFEAAREF